MTPIRQIILVWATAATLAAVTACNSSGDAFTNDVPSPTLPFPGPPRDTVNQMPRP
jgi:hypothetical protein